MSLTTESHLRANLLAAARRMQTLGLNRGTSGNASVRCGDGFLVTPSALPVEAQTPESMVRMSLAGEALGPGKPSSEWRFHRDIFAARPEVGAVLHAHSMYATTLACLRRNLPAVHYMVALAGGDDVRCAPYALFGTQELSDHALYALQGRKACLLANHGLIAVGKHLDEALAVAQEVEFLCELYWRTLQAGGPQLLTPQQMAEAHQQFKGYKTPQTKD